MSIVDFFLLASMIYGARCMPRVMSALFSVFFLVAAVLVVVLLK